MKKKIFLMFFLIFLILCFNLLKIPKVMANPYEDFTTYTEYDTNNRITVTSNRIEHEAWRNEDAYVYDDKGENCFKDFEHLIDFKMENGSGDYRWCFPWGLKNYVDDYYWSYTLHRTYICVQAGMWTSNSWRIYLRESYSGTLYASNAYIGSAGIWYYLNINKTGTALRCEIYSNSNRTTLLSTLNLTLHADHNFRYVFPTNTWNSGHNRWVDLDVENLDIQQIFWTITFCFNAGGIFRVNNATITNGTENVYFNSSILEFLGIVEGNMTYGFNNYTWDSSYSILNPYNFTVLSNSTVWCYFESISISVDYSMVFLAIGLSIGLCLMVVGVKIK